jgi:GT2 family glycosyltransferase
VGDNSGALSISDPSNLIHDSLPNVHCVLVNWNGWKDTVFCVTSLMQQDYAALRIVVVDNGSTDDSLVRIRAAFPQLCVIEAGANLGFSAGSNLGIRRAIEDGADFVWLLNNDTIVPPDTCSKLVASAIREPRAGLIGSVLYYLHDPKKVQAWGGGDLTVWLGRSSHYLAPAKLSPTSYLTFASALIPSEVIRKVGILYEGFFMYWDDADYALRVTAAGYSLSVAEDTAILHKEGGSAEQRSPVIDRYSTAAGLHFLRRHSPVPLLSMVIFVSVKLARRVLRLHWKNAHAVLLAIGDYRKQRTRCYSETL